MPGLISLKTDLKSLKYNSMPLGSDAPYVNKDINKPQSSNGVSMQATKRVDDLTRISKMLIDKPGLKYLANEALLQQEEISKKISGSNKTAVGSILQRVGNTLVGTVKIIGSTLAQVPVNGTGTHFVKGFKSNTYINPTSGALTQFFGAQEAHGAPSALAGEEVVLGKVETKLVKENQVEQNPRTGELSKFNYDKKPDLNFDDIQNISRGNIDNRESAKIGTPITLSQGSIITGPPISRFTPSTPGETDFNRDPRQQGVLIIDAVETTVAKGKLRGTVDKSKISLSTRHSSFEDKDNEGISYSSTNTYTSGSQDAASRAQNGQPIPVGNKTDTTVISGNLPGSKLNPGIVDGQEQILKQNTFISGSEKPLNTYQGTLPTGTPSITNQDVTGSINQSNFTKPVIRDFRENKPENNPVLGVKAKEEVTSYSFDYSARTIKKESRVNLGDQGAASKSTLSYVITDPTGIDGINALEERSSRAGDSDGDKIQDGRDLIKFYFEIITPDGSKFLYFRAFLDSFDDSYSATWDARKYVGRAENFYTYGGFDRSINFSFKIAAATRAEMKPLYRKMVYLASSTAPTYQTNGGFMRGTLAKVTIGSYLSQIPGVIDSVKYSWNKDYPWEIAMQNPENGIDDDMQELPMIMDCSISFKPIHDFAPQTGLKHFITNPAPAGSSKAFF